MAVDERFESLALPWILAHDAGVDAERQACVGVPELRHDL
jgi:hypothetical protein